MKPIILYRELNTVSNSVIERRYSIATSGLATRREVEIPPGIREGRSEIVNKRDVEVRKLRELFLSFV